MGFKYTKLVRISVYKPWLAGHGWLAVASLSRVLAGRVKPKPSWAIGRGSGLHVVRLWATKSWAVTQIFEPSWAGKTLLRKKVKKKNLYIQKKTYSYTVLWLQWDFAQRGIVTNLARHDGAADSHVVKGGRGGHAVKQQQQEGLEERSATSTSWWQWRRVDMAAMDLRWRGGEDLRVRRDREKRNNEKKKRTYLDHRAKAQLVVRRIFMMSVEGIVGGGKGKEVMVDQQRVTWPTHLTGNEGGRETMVMWQRRRSCEVAVSAIPRSPPNVYASSVAVQQPEHGQAFLRYIPNSFTTLPSSLVPISSI
ncbi:hypothetical protein EDB83DRAFT_2316740 [Lactarius deliciosus]|nr:hypothetical protein EDB83DRAFT_2316740 [Lactarius deliciosus]